MLLSCESQQGGIHQPGLSALGPCVRPPLCESSALPLTCTDCTALTPNCHPRSPLDHRKLDFNYSISQYKHYCFKYWEEEALKQPGTSCSLCIKRAHLRDFPLSPYHSHGSLDICVTLQAPSQLWEKLTSSCAFPGMILSLGEQARFHIQSFSCGNILQKESGP